MQSHSRSRTLVFSKMKNLCHHDRDVLIILLDFHNFSIPSLCALVVFSGNYFFPCLCRCRLLVEMKIPVYGCKLFPGLVYFETKYCSASL